MANNNFGIELDIEKINNENTIVVKYNSKKIYINDNKLAVKWANVMNIIRVIDGVFILYFICELVNKHSLRKYIILNFNVNKWEYCGGQTFNILLDKVIIINDSVKDSFACFFIDDLKPICENGCDLHDLHIGKNFFTAKSKDYLNHFLYLEDDNFMMHVCKKHLNVYYYDNYDKNKNGNVTVCIEQLDGTLVERFSFDGEYFDNIDLFLIEKNNDFAIAGKNFVVRKNKQNNDIHIENIRNKPAKSYNDNNYHYAVSYIVNDDLIIIYDYTEIIIKNFVSKLSESDIQNIEHSAVYINCRSENYNSFYYTIDFDFDDTYSHGLIYNNVAICQFKHASTIGSRLTILYDGAYDCYILGHERRNALIFLKINGSILSVFIPYFCYPKLVVPNSIINALITILNNIKNEKLPNDKIDDFYKTAYTLLARVGGLMDKKYILN